MLYMWIETPVVVGEQQEVKALDYLRVKSWNRAVYNHNIFYFANESELSGTLE